MKPSAFVLRARTPAMLSETFDAIPSRLTGLGELKLEQQTA